ncbi:MAG TPA: cytochrome c1 [Rhizomicrobium sp.]|jgi:ubiquinol-cytochrome c reductase cytochrome c1 subunit
MRIARLGLSLAALLVATAAQAAIDTSPLSPKHPEWSFEGPFGQFDRAALQRGFQVYKEVCSTCHSLNRVSFHALSNDKGGYGFFSDPQVKAIAAAYQIDAEPNDKGELFDEKGNRLKRPGIPADHFPPPFANEQAARAANNGALPPDLSIIVKARAGGPDYVYSILTGFQEKPPAGFKVLEGKYFNPYFAGWNISMPPPLSDKQVTYSDGTKATVDQMAKDVVTFLSWAAEPTMEERKRTGFAVMLFLLLLSGLLYLSYRRVWKDLH